MKNLLLEKFQQGNKTVGTFMMMGNSESAECLALSGLDYFIVDTEHGPYDVETALPLIKSAELRGATPLVRIKESSRSSVLKMLDIGAQGLIVPNVKSIDEVKSLIEYGKYAPLGMRGVGAGRGAGYGYSQAASDLVEFFETANRETMIIPQCETVECLDIIDDVVALEGVNGIFIGPFDLSIAMDKFGQFDDPDFKAALEKVLNACKRNNKPCFIFAVDMEAGKKYLQMGFDSVTINTDAAIFTQAYKNMVSFLK